MSQDREIRLSGDDLADDTEAAAWAAHRDGQVTYLTDDHGRIAAIVPLGRIAPEQAARPA